MCYIFVLTSLLLSLLQLVHGEYNITTYVGIGHGDGLVATSSALTRPYGIAFDSSGSMYIADTYANIVRKVDGVSSVMSTIAGSGNGALSGDAGKATSASLQLPTKIAFDTSGNLYIADQNNNVVRKVTVSTGIITTVAGKGSTVGTVTDNIAATSSKLYFPSEIALDSSNNLYIADTIDSRIRKVTVSTSVITTIAGTGTASFTGDGAAATSATINTPYGLALDSSKNVYIADTYNCRVRKITVSTGFISTIAGSSSSTGYSGDNGQATSAKLNLPFSIAIDASGNVYIADSGNNVIRKVTVSTGIIATVAGTGTASYSGDNGAATSATLYSPSGISFDASGNLYIADSYNYVVRKVSSGVITTVAGQYSVGDGTSSTGAILREPYALHVDSSNNLYIADAYSCRIRKVSSTGIISTVAGTGYCGSSADAIAATSAALYWSYGVVTDSNDNLYIGEYFNYKIRKVSNGIITTVAGTGTAGFSGDNGQGTSAKITAVFNVAVDNSNNVYFTDTINCRIRKIDVSTNIITTVAGSSTSGSYTGDGGQATSATLYYPQGLAFDSTGSVMYISDTYNQVIRCVTISTSIITTIAGTGSTGFSGDGGPATSAELNFLGGLKVDSSGNIIVSDTVNNRVRKIDKTTGIITTIAGNGITGYTSDNVAATTTSLFYPQDVAIDSSGNIYVAEMHNFRVRKLSYYDSSTSSLIIDTVAGIGSGDGGAAAAAMLNSPHGVKVDSSGNLYISDYSNQKIRKVSSAGTISTVAGMGYAFYYGANIQATSAVLNYPFGIGLDTSNNIYIADRYSHLIRKVTVSTGIITTVAGKGSTAGTVTDNIAATSSKLYFPSDIALDSSNNLYIADTFDSRIRKVTVSTSVITTIAGTGTATFTGDGAAATSATINSPYGVTLDSSNNVYIADTFNCRVRKITVSTGFISTIAGSSSSTGYSGDNGQATSAKLSLLAGIALDSSGNVYIADSGNNVIRKVTVSSGVITTVAGTGTASYSGDNGAATSATLYYPIGIAFDASGNLYIGDCSNNVVRKVSSGVITTVAGQYSVGDGGTATAALLRTPFGVHVDSSDNVYIGDTFGFRVRKVSSAGIISTISGTGTSGSTGDGGSATSATLNTPVDIATDSNGNVYLSDGLAYKVRKINSNGIISTYVGTGTSGFSGDNGQASSATITIVYSMCVDSSNRLYIADITNNRIRKIDTSTNIITTVAGSSTSGSYTGDGGPATSATLNSPYGVGIDSAMQYLYIADTVNNVIRRVSLSTSVITTIAGTGSTTFAGDGGPASSAGLYQPIGMAVDASDNLYFSDFINNRIRKVNVLSGIITSIAGNGKTGFCSDGVAATTTCIFSPYGVSVDSTGTVYIADTYSYRIRKIYSPSPTSIPTVTPTIVPSALPSTATPTYIPTVTPTVLPTSQPSTATPTYIPTVVPTAQPSTASPTYIPTVTPTVVPSAQPSTTSPTYIPTVTPSIVPSAVPSTDNPTCTPSISPSIVPTAQPSTASPTYIPTVSPSTNTPTTAPSTTPPTVIPSTMPSIAPSNRPTVVPTDVPGTPTFVPTTELPTVSPSIVPSDAPSAVPTTTQPSTLPSMVPSNTPSAVPTTTQPSTSPSIVPSNTPSANPTMQPSTSPSIVPTNTPSYLPTIIPTFIPSVVPTIVPTTTPTIIPTTNPSVMPTVTPTFYPTAIPTYTNSVQIYVIIGHQLVGISSSEYDRAKYDALLQSTICASIPFITDPRDVSMLSMQQFSQVAGTRRLGNSTVDSSILITYAITMSSNLFPSSIAGINGVVNTLNDSITTGFFDDYLHMEAYTANVTVLEKVTSRLQSFQTGSPTSTPSGLPSSYPSAIPTSAPTPFDIIGTNIFNTEINNKVVAVRVKFYLGTYIGYFLVLFVILLLIDKSKLGKKRVKVLELSAFESDVYNMSSRQRETESEEGKVEVKCSRMHELIQSGTDMRDLLRAQQSSENIGDRKLQRLEKKGIKYTTYFYHYLFHERTILGCKPIYYPEGMRINLGFTTVVLPQGLVEDFVLFTCNHNTFFNCLFTIKGGKISRSGNRFIYILSNCIAFFLNCISGSVLNYLGISVYGTILFDIIVISPSTLIVSNIIEQLYSCPIAESEMFRTRYPLIGDKIRYFGRFMILPFMVASFTLLILSALFSKGENSVYIIGMFILQVQLQAFVLEMIISIMLFVPNYHWKFSIYTPIGDFELIEIGKRYVENILLQGLVEGKDYISSSKLYLCLFRLEYCYSYDDALKKGLISLPSNNVVNDDFEMSMFYEADVENGDTMKTAAKKRPSRNSLYKTTTAADTVNPIISATDFSDKAVVYSNNSIYKGNLNESMDNPLHAKSVFYTESERDVTFSSNAIYKGNLNEITDNPLHKKVEVVESGPVVRVSYSDVYDPSDGAFKTETVSTSAVIADEIMTEELLEQYNNLTEIEKTSLHNALKSELHLNDAEITRITSSGNHSDNSFATGWKMAKNIVFRKKAATTSLESLKSHIIKEIKRKELKKQGLRRSFISTFRFFEEREQINTSSKPELNATAIRAKGIHTDGGNTSNKEEK